jgi:UDP-sulfoquinovose synthase
LIQSQIGHPLTVYGTGGQTRAFIHIQDTVRCIRLAIENPPENKSKVRVMNQTTECLNVLELADKIQTMTGAKIRYYKNQREEAVENKLRMSNKNLIDMGLTPITLDDKLLDEAMTIARKYKDRCDHSKIITDSR